MHVKQLMTTAPQCCRPDDTLDHAAHLMWDHDCGCLPICTDDGSTRVIGMITDRDIWMAAHFQGRSLKELRVAQTMPHHQALHTCRADETLATAERRMREARVRRLPVVDEDGALMGMLSLADLARKAARERKRKRPAISETEVGNTLAAICEAYTKAEYQSGA